MKNSEVKTYPENVINAIFGDSAVGDVYCADDGELEKTLDEIIERSLTAEGRELFGLLYRESLFESDVAKRLGVAVYKVREAHSLILRELRRPVNARLLKKYTGSCKKPQSQKSGRRKPSKKSNRRMYTIKNARCPPRSSIMNCSKNNGGSSTPHYGIFWAIAETESELIADNLFCVIEPYTEAENDEKQVFNHKRHWQMSDRKITHGKPFDYYPRGRVEIRHGKATVWLNGNILHLADKIIEIYGLSTLPQVRVKVDGSKHYISHFD